MANGCGAIWGHTLYIAGGIEGTNSANAMRNFWALDLAAGAGRDSFPST